jgi:beta-phosphoglucomutase
LAIPPKAILFDFDGTLVDSEPLHYEAWLHAVAPYGASTDWIDYQERFVGQTGKWAAEAFFDDAGVSYDAHLVAQAVDTKTNYFRQRAEERLVLSLEVVQAIKQLPVNLLLGVVTSSDRLEVEPALLSAGLLNRLTVVICGGDVSRHKPHPEPYLSGLRELRTSSGRSDVTAADVIVYEDSRSGIAAGRAAGMIVRQVLAPHEIPGMLAAEDWS